MPEARLTLETSTRKVRIAVVGPVGNVEYTAIPDGVTLAIGTPVSVAVIVVAAAASAFAVAFCRTNGNATQAATAATVKMRIRIFLIAELVGLDCDILFFLLVLKIYASAQIK